MSDDEIKRAILSRRAKFVAAAIAAAGLTSSCSPDPCLSPRREDDASTDAPKDGTTDAPADGPQVCLSPIEPDAGADADGGSDAPADAPKDTGSG